MRILVISSYSKSLTNFRKDLLVSFVEKGHDVMGVGPDYDSEVNDILSSLSIKYNTYYLERTGTNIVSDLKSYISLKRIIRNYKPDLVFSYTIKPVIYGGLAAKRMKVPKIYAMITGLGSAFQNSQSLKQRIISRITEYLYRKSLKNISGVIYQNPDDRQIFIDKGLVDEKKTFRVNGSGVDVNYFTPVSSMLNPLKFLFIGRIIKDKGIAEFIAAAQIIYKKYPETEFHIVGWADNNPSGISNEELEVWEKLQFLKFHGKVDDVRPFIEDSSVFVLPSYREGTPRTALEAMAMSKPLIMTDAPGCRETVREGVNGFLVPLKNPKKIAEAMEKFINTRELITKMGIASRSFVEEVYDVDKVNHEINDILGLNE